MSNFKGIYAVIYKNFTYIPISLPSDFLLELIFFPLIMVKWKNQFFFKVSFYLCIFTYFFSFSVLMPSSLSFLYFILNFAASPIFKFTSPLYIWWSPNIQDFISCNLSLVLCSKEQDFGLRHNQGLCSQPMELSTSSSLNWGSQLWDLTR